MFDSSTIFQRTQAGRDEIKQKSHGLTQSERLVLIMIDGVAPAGEVRRKLPALTDERFKRALHKLQQKELILEVFMPVEGQAAEKLESSVIDRFLQQDPLDPVTIIMQDPDDELDAHLSGSQTMSVKREPPPATSAIAKPVATVVATPAPEPELEPEPESLPSEQPDILPKPAHATAQAEYVIAMDAVHSEIADSLAQEVRQRQVERPVKTGQVERRPAGGKAAPANMHIDSLHWGYWLIGIGCTLIGSFFILQIIG